MTSQVFIPFHRPSIGEEECAEVRETLESGWLTTGPRVTRFETEFRDYCDARHSIAVNSATAGLHLALASLGIGPGDEVITTPMTFCATVHAILHVGATPVLADIGTDGNIDPKQIEQLVGPRTRAIVPVHLAGLPCEMNTIWELAKKRGIHVVEDAAHAVGAWYDGRPIGAEAAEPDKCSAAVAFSFYATKSLTTGEGGMITTNRMPLAEAMRALSLHGLSHDAWDRYSDHGDWRYDVLAHGFKYNLSDVQAAIGIHQLRKLNRFIETRTRYAHVYDSVLGGMDEVELPSNSSRCRHAWHLYILRLNLHRLRIDRDEFIKELRQRGVGASVHFIPIPLLRFFTGMGLARYECRRALELFPRIVSLPLYPAMNEEQVQYVAQTVRSIVECSRALQVAVPGAYGGASQPSV